MLILALLAMIAAEPQNQSQEPAPLNDITSWFTPDDYPPAAIRSGEQGAVRFTLDVSANGVVTKCQVVTSSGFPDLDNQTCALATTRAHFSPAMDGKGKPISSTFTRRMRWEMPSQPGDPVILSKKLIDADVDVDAVGRVTACKISPNQPFMIDVCAAFPVGTVTPVDFNRPPGPARLKAIIVLGSMVPPTPHNP